MLALIAVNTLVFLWMLTLPPRSLRAVLVELALIPIRYADPRVSNYLGLDAANWWPLLTNTFLHGGWLHLIGNMWFLWIFGPAMEARLGRLGFVILYLGGGVAASLMHVLTHPQSLEPVLGASGAIAAVIAAYAVTFPAARIVTIIPILFIPLFVPIPALWFALFWFGLQVVQGSSELMSPAMAGSVAWWAHIGGFAFGIVFAVAAKVTGFSTGISTSRWDTVRGRRVPDIPRRR